MHSEDLQTAIDIILASAMLCELESSSLQVQTKLELRHELDLQVLCHDHEFQCYIGLLSRSDV